MAQIPNVHDVQHKEQRLRKGKKALKIGFSILMIGALVLALGGAAINNGWLVYNAFFVALASPIFLVALGLVNRKLKKLGV